jgi:hypothetical protein
MGFWSVTPIPSRFSRRDLRMEVGDNSKTADKIEIASVTKNNSNTI